MIDIEKKEFGPQLRTLAAEWDELLARSSRPTIYSTFDYVYTSCLHFRGGDELFFLLMRDVEDGRLLAVFPVRISTAIDCGRPIRRVEAGIAPIATEADKPYPVIDKAHEEVCWERFSAYIRRQIGRWDLLVYDELWPQSGLNRNLGRLFPWPGYWTRVRAGAESPIFRLDCEWDAYWNAHRRLRRKIRSMQKQLGERYCFRVTCDPGEVQGCLDAYVSTELAGAKAEGGMMREEKLRFYRELLPKLAAKKQLYFAILQDGDEMVGVHIAFVFGPHVYFALSACNTEYAHLSPGMVLHFLFIQYFCAKGYREGDFLAGFAHYLYPWASHVEQTVNVQVRKISWNNGIIFLKKLRARFRPAPASQ